MRTWRLYGLGLAVSRGLVYGCAMDALIQGLSWYLSPWRRIGRGTFNLVLAVAAVPSLLLGVWGMVDGVGGLLAPLAGMLDASRSLQQGVGAAGGPDAGLLGDALRHMQGLGGNSGAPAPVASLAWAELLDLTIWLALLPLMQMRLRDMGVVARNIWPLTAVLYAGLLADDAKALVGVDLLAGWGWLAGFVGFVLLAWMTVAKSRPRGQDGVTDSGVSAKVALDDTDPYPPFRP